MSTFALATLFFWLSHKKWRLLSFVPPIVLLYAVTMLLSYLDLISTPSDLVLKLALPMMLFLIVASADVRLFVTLGRKLLLSYALALLSIVVAFVSVAKLFGFASEEASAFGALSGSWMGGVANMIAVAKAIDLSDASFGSMLIVDSINYSIWVALLFFLIPFAPRFNAFTASSASIKPAEEASVTRSRSATFVVVLLSFAVALLANKIAQAGFVVLNYTTTTVLISSLAGMLLWLKRERAETSSVSSFLLYLLVAIIGSEAVFSSFDGLARLAFAGFSVLLIHAVLMVLGAKIFRLDLFSISVASLANIGGVASASILAAAHSKDLASVGAVMAIMGYLVGTIGGLMVAKLLIYLGG